MFPELSGREVTLVPMRLDEAGLLVRWVNENPEHWFGQMVGRVEVLRRWPPEVFDDAYPMKGRAFRIEVARQPVGAVVHGAVFGQPRNARLDLVLAGGAEARSGGDAVEALARYLFDALRVRVLWAELVPADARGLEAFTAAGFEPRAPTPEGRVVLRRERSEPHQQKGQIPPRR